ncbi:MAG: NADH-quinone oxidoreductase subunit NuoG [Armatimonadota bacterium]
MATETQAPSVPMVTLSIDGREVQVPKGTNVIEAARKLGIQIPYLCYHHQLTPFGGCRLCLVEVEKVPKLLAACNTLVADGMVVRTTTSKVREQRSGALEFILLNHPLDCPVCDKGGECELQDRVFEHSNAISRATEPKIHIEDYDLGPLVVRNQDRCIICKRCVKVMEEVVGDPVLEFGQRGITTEVYTFEHEEFRPGFSGNTIRVCPVGALMSKPFRFTARPWELQKTPSVCSLCSVGCNVRRDVRENKLLRVVGLENPQVNDGWLCDRGQFGYDYVNSAERLAAPLIRRSKGGALEPVSWDEALGFVASRLKQVKESGGAFAALGSERICNEDAYVLQQFTREVMGSAHVDHRAGSTRTGYQAQRPTPGAIAALPKADAVLVIGSDVTAEAPVLDLVLKRSILPKKSKLIVANPRATALDKFAAQTLQYLPGREIALVNALVQAVLEEGGAGASLAGIDAVRQGLGGATVAQLAESAGATEAAVRQAAKTFAGAKLGSILYGQAAADGRDGGYFIAALQNLAQVAGQSGKDGHLLLEVVREANTWGVRDLGLLPDTGPAGAPVTRGKSTSEIIQAAADGQLQALYVVGANPAVELPGGEKVQAALRSVPLLVVQDLFLTETAELADVVFPSVDVSERNATLTNIEGRVQRAVRSMDPRGASKEDWRILSLIAEEMGQPLGYTTAESVLKQIRAAFAGKNGQGKPAGLQRVETPAALGRDAAFPLRLFTGRLMFDRSALQGRSTVIPGLAPDPFVEINPADAQRYGIEADSLVTVETAVGALRLTARVSTSVPAGHVFVPEGYSEAPVSTLLTEGASVVSCRIAGPEARPEARTEA